MGQRTTYGNSPADEIFRPQPSCERAAQSEGSAAGTLELLRALAHNNDGSGQAQSTLELLRTLARRRDSGDPTEHTLDLLRTLAHKTDSGERIPHLAPASAHAAPTALASHFVHPAAMRRSPLEPPPPRSRGLAAAIAGLKAGARSAGARRPSTRGERAAQVALVAGIGSAALLAAALAVSLLWSRGPGRDVELRTEIGAPIATPSEPAATPSIPAQAVVQSVQTAMAECDREAEKDPGALHFLVTPIMPVGDAFRLSAEAREEYDSFSLVTAKAMIEGLQGGSLALNARPFRFAIIDSATGQTQTWSAATGMSKFTHKEAAAFSKFRVGFDIPDKGPQWSNEYPRRAGVCYWVNARFHWG